MKRIVAGAVVCAVLLCATGCGGPDSLIRELIVNLNAYAETVEKKEPPDKQLAARDRARATAEKIDKLKLSKEDQEKLLKKHEAALRKVFDRIQAAHKNQAMEGGAVPPDVLDGFFK
ncbi:MAG: hypothetical protein FJ304_04960 [Planctomycetes bacterium]|nr:hypothetical protein [Planctomycetota bacterium]